MAGTHSGVQWLFIVLKERLAQQFTCTEAEHHKKIAHEERKASRSITAIIIASGPAVWPPGGCSR